MILAEENLFLIVLAVSIASVSVSVIGDGKSGVKHY